MRRPLLIALGCAAAAAAVYGLTLHTTPGGRADAAVLDAFARLRGALDGIATDLVRFLDPAPFALLAAALVTLALARGMRRQAVVAAGVLGGAALTSQLLKPLLAAPRPWETPAAAEIVGGSWPSGHTTAAVALALCAVLVVPRRPVRIAAALFAVGVACSLVLLGTHWPSDVLGGFCVAGAWFALGVAVLPHVRVPALSSRLLAALVGGRRRGRRAGRRRAGRERRPRSSRTTPRSPRRRPCSAPRAPSCSRAGRPPAAADAAGGWTGPRTPPSCASSTAARTSRRPAAPASSG